MELLLHIRKGRGVRRQIVEQLRRAILDQRLPPGARLPATRVLAAELGVSRMVVSVAYDHLMSEGYLETHRGVGTFVASGLALPRVPDALRPSAHPPRWLHAIPPPHIREAAAAGSCIEFRLGVPEVPALPPRAWQVIWRDVGRERPPSDYGSPTGDPQLRAAIARYLGRARGIVCRPDAVMITSGAIQALDLIARATLQPGDPVAVEDPGYPEAAAVLAARGGRIVPIPVDDDGLRVERLAKGPEAPLLVYATPSHQYPIGGRLPMVRRAALLEWARSADSLIIEDDYDSEFRYDAPPLPALAGLDTGGCVAYIGTFSKVLTPALRVGYLLAPPPLRERIAHLRLITDRHTGWYVQRALARLIDEGIFDRHIRSARRRYARKRAILQEAFASLAPLARLRGVATGLHAFLEMDASLDVAEVVRHAATCGVVVHSLGSYYIGTPDRQGLLLGYGGLSAEDVERGACILRDVIRRLSPLSPPCRSAERQPYR
jgi:GntR family transcriptional regulator/MocR family aminotransferase